MNFYFYLNTAATILAFIENKKISAAFKGRSAKNAWIREVNYKTQCVRRPSFVQCLHSNKSKKIGAVYPSDARMSKMDMRMFD